MLVRNNRPDSWLPNKASFLMLTWALVLGGFLIVSALGKVIDRGDTFSHLKLFTRVAGFDHPVPWLTGALFVSLVLAEIVLGALLISGYLTRVAMLLTFALMCVFSGWLVYANVRGLKSGCGCGLAVADVGLGWSLARNGVIGLFCLAYVGAANRTMCRQDTSPIAERVSRPAHP